MWPYDANRVVVTADNLQHSVNHYGAEIATRSGDDQVLYGVYHVPDKIQ